MRRQRHRACHTARVEGDSPAGARRIWFTLGAVAAAIVTLLFATIGDGTSSGSEEGLLLEFGHVGVWALLTAALGVAAVVGRWQRISSIFALGALGLYATFLVALLTN